MNPEYLTRQLLAALGHVKNPADGTDVVTSGKVRDVSVDGEGAARFSVVLAPDDPSHLIADARKAAEAVSGIDDVKVKVQLPKANGAQAGPHTATPRRRPLRPGSVPAPTPQPGLLDQVGSVVAVSSGKGGVGKSMIATNLAAELARRGYRVGLMDADIYGPNIPLMFGETRKPRVSGDKGKEKIEPLEAHGVRLMSLGFLLEKEQPAIMRGPLISGILKQFVEQVEWGPLDVMVVDMPPGTGDAQLSLVQTIDLAGAVMVTTPQPVSTGDVRRGIKMFERVNTPVLGIVENMSGFVCPHCEEDVDVFGSGGGEALASEMDVPFLGRVPLDPRVRVSGDEGRPTVLALPESAAAKAIAAIADRLPIG